MKLLQQTPRQGSSGSGSSWSGGPIPGLGKQSKPLNLLDVQQETERMHKQQQRVQQQQRVRHTHTQTSLVCSPENQNKYIMGVSLYSGVMPLHCGERLDLWMERWVGVAAPLEEGWESGTRPSRTRAHFATTWGWRTAAAVPHWGKHKPLTAFQWHIPISRSVVLNLFFHRAALWSKCKSHRPHACHLHITSSMQTNQIYNVIYSLNIMK